MLGSDEKKPKDRRFGAFPQSQQNFQTASASKIQHDSHVSNLGQPSSNTVSEHRKRGSERLFT